MNDQEVIQEFLAESSENLVRLDQEMVELEKTPKDAGLLASVFRTFHTMKGTCGFLGFGVMEAIAHSTEGILSQLRAGTRALSPELVSLILRAVDALKHELASIAAAGKESGQNHDALREELEAAHLNKDPEPDAPAPVETVAPNRVVAADGTIRVDVGLLDKLMNLVGELVLARNQVLQFHGGQQDRQFAGASQRLDLITTELQEGVMKTRMQPIGVVWGKLPRVVRDISASMGKQIGIEMEGAGTELDRTIIEAIKDPLTHLVRNCCDHGIEDPATRERAGKPPQGRLLLRAYHEGGQVTIEVSDDGSGIDVEKVKSKAVDLKVITRDQAERMPDRDALHLIFRAGLSTSTKVSNVSGRGVGMDVVKTNVEKIGGTVDLVSTVGQGTTFKLKIPLTLAIIPGLIVTSGESRSAPREGTGRGLRFVIPQVSLVELIRVEGDSSRRGIEQIQGCAVYRRRGALLPLVYLNQVLELGGHHERPVTNIVVLQAEDRQFGLVVDGIQDTQEIVVKPLGKLLKGISTYAGATILGDGKVALILDVMGIGQQSGVLARRLEEKQPVQQQVRSDEALKENFLLFRSGRFERLAVPLLRIARLEEFPPSKVEHADGRMVIQYRGEILGLVPLSDILDSEASALVAGDGPLQVIVFNDGGRRIGLLVDEILDIVEANVVAQQQSRRPGLLCAAVLEEKVTDFLDLDFVLRKAFAEDRRAEASTESVSGLIAALEPARVAAMEGSREY